MKICYIADAGDIHTEKWVAYFADKGHEVHLISFRPLQDYINGVHLHILKEVSSRTKICKYTINALFVFYQINKLLKQISPDIVHGHSIRDHTIIGGLTSFHPFVVTPWGSDVFIYFKESKIMKYMIPFTLRNSDLITCDGENTKEIVIDMGIDTKKISIIMFGVDTKKFDFSVTDEKLKNELEIYDSPVVISTRRLGYVHNVETLIKAVPLVLSEISDTKFVIAGEGEQKEYLINTAKSLGIYNAIRFVGFIPNDELPKYIVSSDVYVSTSLSDSGLSTGTAEAMACGLATVVSDSGDNRKWIKNGVNGFIVPLKDPKVLAEKIVYLLKNKDVRMKFGMENRKIIENRNNYYKEMGKMENIYMDLIGMCKK